MLSPTTLPNPLSLCVHSKEKREHPRENHLVEYFEIILAKRACILGLYGGLNMALSFARDIRQLFRDEPDVESMKDMGLDLSSYADVKEQAEGIYARLEDGSMPCDGPWPSERIATFKRWMDEGMQP